MNILKLAKNYNYTVPSQAEKRMMDFYLLSWIYSMSDEIKMDEDLLYSVEDGLTELTQSLKKEFDKYLLFCINCEFRHVFAVNSPDKVKKYFKSRGNWDLIKEYLRLTLDAKNATPAQGEFNREIKQVLNVKDEHKNIAVNDDYARQFGVFVASKIPAGVLVPLARDAFVDLDWEGSYGGKKWQSIAQGWISLKNSKGLLNDIVYIDHVYDLAHNTGPALNKVKEYKGEWVNAALEFKKYTNSPWFLWERASPVAKEMSVPVLKIAKVPMPKELQQKMNNQSMYNKKETEFPTAKSKIPISGMFDYYIDRDILNGNSKSQNILCHIAVAGSEVARRSYIFNKDGKMLYDNMIEITVAELIEQYNCEKLSSDQFLEFIKKNKISTDILDSQSANKEQNYADTKEKNDSKGTNETVSTPPGKIPLSPSYWYYMKASSIKRIEQNKSSETPDENFVATCGVAKINGMGTFNGQPSNIELMNIYFFSNKGVTTKATEWENSQDKKTVMWLSSNQNISGFPDAKKPSSTEIDMWRRLTSAQLVDLLKKGGIPLDSVFGGGIGSDPENKHYDANTGQVATKVPYATNYVYYIRTDFAHQIDYIQSGGKSDILLKDINIVCFIEDAGTGLLIGSYTFGNNVVKASQPFSPGKPVNWLNQHTPAHVYAKYQAGDFKLFLDTAGFQTANIFGDQKGFSKPKKVPATPKIPYGESYDYYITEEAHNSVLNHDFTHLACAVAMKGEDIATRYYNVSKEGEIEHASEIVQTVDHFNSGKKFSHIGFYGFLLAHGFPASVVFEATAGAKSVAPSGAKPTVPATQKVPYSDQYDYYVSYENFHAISNENMDLTLKNLSLKFVCYVALKGASITSRYYIFSKNGAGMYGTNVIENVSQFQTGKKFDHYGFYELLKEHGFDVSEIFEDMSLKKSTPKTPQKKPPKPPVPSKIPYNPNYVYVLTNKDVSILKDGPHSDWAFGVWVLQDGKALFYYSCLANGKVYSAVHSDSFMSDFSSSEFQTFSSVGLAELLNKGGVSKEVFEKEKVAEIAVPPKIPLNENYRYYMSTNDYEMLNKVGHITLWVVDKDKTLFFYGCQKNGEVNSAQKSNAPIEDFKKGYTGFTSYGLKTSMEVAGFSLDVFGEDIEVIGDDPKYAPAINLHEMTIKAINSGDNKIPLMDKATYIVNGTESWGKIAFCEFTPDGKKENAVFIVATLYSGVITVGNVDTNLEEFSKSASGNKLLNKEQFKVVLTNLGFQDAILKEVPNGATKEKTNEEFIKSNLFLKFKQALDSGDKRIPLSKEYIYYSSLINEASSLNNISDLGICFWVFTQDGKKENAAYLIANKEGLRECHYSNFDMQKMNPSSKKMNSSEIPQYLQSYFGELPDTFFKQEDTEGTEESISFQIDGYQDSKSNLDNVKNYMKEYVSGLQITIPKGTKLAVQIKDEYSISFWLYLPNKDKGLYITLVPSKASGNPTLELGACGHAIYDTLDKAVENGKKELSISELRNYIVDAGGKLIPQTPQTPKDEKDEVNKGISTSEGTMAHALPTNGPGIPPKYPLYTSINPVDEEEFNQGFNHKDETPPETKAFSSANWYKVAVKNRT